MWDPAVQTKLKPIVEESPLTKASASTATGIISEVDTQLHSGTLKTFDLSALGLNHAEFIKDVTPTFNDLPWDQYDVRRAQLEAIERTFSGELRDLGAEKVSYYKGELDLGQFLNMIAGDTEIIRPSLDTIKPYRRRALAEFNLDYTSINGWTSLRTAVKPLAQQVEETDIRSVQRQFAEASEVLTDMGAFKQLLYGIAEMAREVNTGNGKLRITLWQNRNVVYPGMTSTNSPEGVHQDGADFIVSALVMERMNIIGGCSKSFGADKKAELLSTELQPGQGIFQSDTGSDLWHDVTPIRLADPNAGIGYRSIFGFDIYVL